MKDEREMTSAELDGGLRGAQAAIALMEHGLGMFQVDISSLLAPTSTPAPYPRTSVVQDRVARMLDERARMQPPQTITLNVSGVVRRGMLKVEEEKK